MFNEKNLAILSYLTVCIVWGSTYLVIRVAVNDMPFLAFAGVRFFTAGGLILIAAKIKGWSFPSKLQDYKTLVFAGAMLLFVSNGLICWAEMWIESGLAALLIASVPLFMALIELIVPGDQKIGRLGWVGLVVGFIGVAFLVSPHLALKGQTLPAMLAALAASLNWAIASTPEEKDREWFNDAEYWNPDVYSRDSIFGGCLIFRGNIACRSIKQWNRGVALPDLYRFYTRLQCFLLHDESFTGR